MIYVTESAEMIKRSNKYLRYSDDSGVILRETGDFYRETVMAVLPDEKSFSGNRRGKKKEEYLIQNRGECLASLRRTFQNIIDLVNCNVTESNKNRCLWVTLTYSKCERDSEKIYRDFTAYIKRMKRYLKKDDFDKFEYIAVVEPQASGSYHYHVIFIFEKPCPFIPNNEIMEKKLWRNGFTKTKKIPDGNIGAYLAAYLANIAMEEQDDKYTGNEKESRQKRVIKGARVHFYPAGMKIIRTSRNIKRPIKSRLTKAEADAITKDAKLLNKYDYLIFDDESGKCINSFSKIIYKK